MKKSTLLLFLIINYTSAQEYTPMLANVNEWHLSTCFQGDCGIDKYYTDGDTIVNNMNYKILDGYHYISRSFMMREEIDNQKVYLLTFINNIQREYLLYDFTLEIGDVFEMTNPITPFPENGGEFELTNIELLELEDGNEYKHYYFSPTDANTTSTWNAIWVEGVGSLAIPNAPGGNPDFDGAGRVSCAFRDGNLFYTDYTIVNECIPFLGLTNNIEQDKPIVFMGQDYLYVKNLKQYKRVHLFSISGQRYESINNNGEASIEIATGSLKKGIYLLQFITEDGDSISKKVIVR